MSARTHWIWGER